MIVRRSCALVVNLIFRRGKSCWKAASFESENFLVCEGSSAVNHPLSAGVLSWLRRAAAALGCARGQRGASFRTKGKAYPVRRAIVAKASLMYGGSIGPSEVVGF